MISIIETAVVTIVVTVISGLLLDHYKNLGPRIVCRLGKCTPLKLYSRNYYAYVLTVGNTSKKTIHRLTINIQSLQNRLNFTNAKITRGLKFDSSIKSSTLDVSIPYLSKDDKFLVTVYSENKFNACSKPNIIIRSPENFKEIDYMGQNEILSSLSNIPKNINKTFSKTKGKSSKSAINKNLIIAVTAVIVVAAFGVLGASYSKMTSDNKPESVIQKQPSDANDSKSKKIPENSNAKSSSKRSAKNTNSDSSNKVSNQSAGSGSSSNGGNTQSTNGGSNSSNGGNTSGSMQSKDDSKSTNTGSGSSGSSGSNTTQNTGSTGSPSKDSTTSPSKSGSQNTTTTNSQPGTSSQSTSK